MFSHVFSVFRRCRLPLRRTDFESVPTVGLYWILLEISGRCWKIVPKKSVPAIRLCSTLVSSTPDQADFASLEKSLESRLFAGLKKEKKGRFSAILRGFSGFCLPLKWTDFESVPVNGFLRILLEVGGLCWTRKSQENPVPS